MDSAPHSEAIDSIDDSLDENLAFARTVAGEQALRIGLTIERVISTGDFSVVCRGRTSDHNDVAIKVLKRSPIQGVLKNLEEVASRRRELKDPDFIELYDTFVAHPALEEHLVLVTEYCGAPRLVDELKNGPFSIDDTVLLIRRAADALATLHQLAPSDKVAVEHVDVSSYGLMMPEHLFYDKRLRRLRLSSLSIGNFIWDVLGWRKYAAYVDLTSSASARYVAPEQMSARVAAEEIDKQKLDQYMLGQLALVMLDGKLWFESNDLQDMAESKKEFFEKPLKGANAWTEYHSQLAQIISKMLAQEPAKRFSSMGDVAAQLRGVEAEGRALARYSFQQWLHDDEFFDAFYQRFFANAKNAKSKFGNPGEQHLKLQAATIEVLNFYSGNEPTSLNKLALMHAKKQVTYDEMKRFRKSFLVVVRKRLKAKEVDKTMGAEFMRKVLDGWKDLLMGVIEYLKRADESIVGSNRPTADESR